MVQDFPKLLQCGIRPDNDGKRLTSSELSDHINFMEGRIEKLRRNTCHVRMEEYVYLFSFLDKVLEIKLIDAKDYPWQ